MVQEAMNTRVRSAVQTAKASSNHDKEKDKMKTETQSNYKRSITAEKGGFSICQSRKERKTTLQQDVDKLRKKLRLEESVHRALERAFTRPLGVLPRLPPYLPKHTLELLAEVAVLEEEVIRLEEQVVSFRQGLYREAIYFSSSKRTNESTSDSYLDQNNSLNMKASEQLNPSLNFKSSEASSIVKPSASMSSLDSDQNGPSSCTYISVKQTPKKFDPSSTCTQDGQGKENKLDAHSPRNHKQSLPKQASKTSLSALERKQTMAQAECVVMLKDITEMNALKKAELNKSSGPNKLSEDILRCLMNIFLLMETKSTEDEPETSPTISGSCDSFDEIDFRDPYGICTKFGRRDIGAYKHFHVVEISSSHKKLLTPSSTLTRRLKILLRKLAQVDLTRLTHQQKLAFWINIYNSCIMNTFLEQGIPASPEMVVTLMQKAAINVGGHLLRAMTIEHFILRLPYNSKLMPRRQIKINDVTRGSFGLEWPEPLVTFALSCGSWSSPVVRVYTASQVENELENAKQDYLQATVGISTSSKLAIPKLLDWYLLDFAKDIESLMDWVCLQLPSELRSNAVKCIEMNRRSPVPQPIQVLPYEFRFRYLLAP